MPPLSPSSPATACAEPLSRPCRGTTWRVRGAAAILATLDADGRLDGVPVMPEMLGWLGSCVTISHRAEKVCIDGAPEGVRQFRGNDVVFLKDTRCDGSAHGGCGRACLLFWKEAWLANPSEPVAPDSPADVEALRARLQTRQPDGRALCQSTEILTATTPLSRIGRLRVILRELRVGNRGVLEMLRLVWFPVAGKLLQPFTPRYVASDRDTTPTESLGLQPGDWVQVKSLEEIRATLDREGRNRGLQFSRDLAVHCGRRYRVRNRVESLIVEVTGRQMTPRNTVILEGVHCPCRYVVGGCPRADLIYWREVWLRRVDGPGT